MSNEQIKQKINNYIEVRKNLWTAILLLSGGIAGLFLSFSSLGSVFSFILRYLLFLIGLYIDIMLLKMSKECNGSIAKLLNKLD